MRVTDSKAVQNLGTAPRSGGGRAHHRRRFGRRRPLQGSRYDAQVVEVPVPVVMRDHGLGESGGENVQSFVETRSCGTPLVSRSPAVRRSDDRACRSLPARATADKWAAPYPWCRAATARWRGRWRRSADWAMDYGRGRNDAEEDAFEAKPLDELPVGFRGGTSGTASTAPRLTRMAEPRLAHHALRAELGGPSTPIPGLPLIHIRKISVQYGKA